MAPYRSPFRHLSNASADRVFKTTFFAWLGIAAAIVLVAFSLNGGGTLFGAPALWSDASGWALFSGEGFGGGKDVASCAFQATLFGGYSSTPGSTPGSSGFYCTLTRGIGANTNPETMPCCTRSTGVQLQTWWRAWQMTGCHDYTGGLICAAINSIKLWCSVFVALLSFTIVVLLSAFMGVSEALWQMWAVQKEEQIASLRLSPLWWLSHLLPALFCPAFVASQYGVRLTEFLVNFRDETLQLDESVNFFNSAPTPVGVRFLSYPFPPPAITPRLTPLATPRSPPPPPCT